jgi:MerR family regulatory protein
MAALTIRDVSRRSGLSEPTLRYYEEIGNGYLGTQLVAALLRDGREVRAAVRSMDREAGLRTAVRRGGADDTGLESDAMVRLPPARASL